jgi:UDP-2,3-diacylglucosamine pyrophosphatase LpxH
MKTKRLIVFPLFTLAVIFLFSFIGWALSCHGTMGLLRLIPIFLYILVLIFALGIILIGLFLWYCRLSRWGKGEGGSRLYIFLVALSTIYIVLFAYAFVLLDGFPHARDIEPVSQLSVPNTDGQNLHFAVGSDTQFGAGTNSPNQTIAMLNQISNPANEYDLFFFLGDLVEYGFKDSQWSEALQVFSPTAMTIPTRFVPGNHDTLFGGLSRYLYYCSPTTIESQNGSKLWYRVDVGRVHFLTLDVEWSAETFTKQQKEWLETQLKSIPSGDWKIIMSHGFYYSSGKTSLGWNWFDNHETISALAPLFEQYGVDMVFSGHNHYLEFLQHSGVNYVVCGGFGGKPDSAPTNISSSSIWLQSGQFGFADVSIDGNQATLNFRDPDSNILKSFTIAKH